MFPKLKPSKYPELPEELKFLHAEEILDMYPDLPRKQRETRILQEYPAVFIIGIGWPLEDGYPHEMRAADYDDWVTETVAKNGKPMHGLNGDILVWNPVTKRRHELTSMGIRVTKETLVQQLKMAGLEKDLELPYHQAILNDRDPAVDRRRHRPVAHLHVPAAQGAPRRGERHGLARSSSRRSAPRRTSTSSSSRTRPPVRRRASHGGLRCRSAMTDRTMLLWDEPDGRSPGWNAAHARQPRGAARHPAPRVERGRPGPLRPRARRPRS